MADNGETPKGDTKFDFSSYPANTLFHERRTGQDRRVDPAQASAPILLPGAEGAPAEKRSKKDRRRRIDPTTFEKQYTDDELEFMNAMQKFKVQSGKAFPTHGEVLQVAFSLGYRQVIVEDEPGDGMLGNEVIGLG